MLKRKVDQVGKDKVVMICSDSSANCVKGMWLLVDMPGYEHILSGR
jgi:hypothetical protein